MVMIKRWHDGSVGRLRDRIFEVLINSPTSGKEDLQALAQCASHIRNTAIVQSIAKEQGLRLSKCRVDQHMELYYDISHGRHGLGFISKGWTDPGFRIGDLFSVSRAAAESFKPYIFDLLKFCATNGITVTMQETEGKIELTMDAVIYSEGFNKDTFQNTLDALSECVEKAEKLLSTNNE